VNVAREKIIYERVYVIYIRDEGAWERFDTPAEAGRRVEELLREGREVNADVEERRAA
jgi:(2Fe-2S) ferredoxin